MAKTTFYNPKSRQQKGAIAIEFVFIFPVLFTICYAVIAYALAFLVVQNMTYTSEEILRKAIGFNNAACEDIADPDEKAACALCDEAEGETKAECEINVTYNRFASEMLLFSGADSARYAKTSSCDVDLICTLEIRTAPLTATSIFGFTLLDLSNNPESKLVSKASLLF